MFATTKSTALFAVIAIALHCVLFPAVDGVPSIGHYGKRFDTMSGIDFIQICLNNCAQCKKMFGDYFQGQACAESCLKFKGKAIPDCEDIGSIAPFLNALE
ncbi:eclosion hormone [Anastrepha obliqua]|uniref:eclosion hormone n=1 Tax=Anastrepha ludens TaxID=28586 RepID=UPI0023AFD7AF|nr:eclosion hormone [Anastrepha ludens]XP_053951928.1 eclosion hormone [Anastrepha ludens]XP_054747573.1 eclosion hormone [Anastrepha obliqua]